MRLDLHLSEVQLNGGATAAGNKDGRTSRSNQVRLILLLCTLCACKLTYCFPHSKLRELPEDIHLFCPREGGDSSVYYDEDRASYDTEEDDQAKEQRRAHIEEAEKRKWIALDSLQILAYDGEEAEPHKQWVLKRMNEIMASCDVCVRRFHQCRTEWRQRLEE